jgi:hypothetical protein
MNEDSDIIGDECELVCTYSTGLEGSITNYNTDLATIEFSMHDPTIVTTREFGSSPFTLLTSLVSNRIASRTRAGVWDDLASGVTGGTVSCILRHPNGLIFVGGAFTGAGATSADFCAIYNPATDTWSNINGSDTTFNAAVSALALDAAGNVYIGGAFTNAAGIANADGICVVNSLGTGLAALGTGAVGGNVLALKLWGQYIVAGGTFTSMGGVASTNSIARWSLVSNTWLAIVTGVSGGNGVYALETVGQYLYAGGTFTAMSAVANTVRLAYTSYAFPSWVAMGTGADAVINVLRAHPVSGDLYIGGSHTTLSGLSNAYLSLWDGTNYRTVGVVAGPVVSMHFDSANRLWFGGDFGGAANVDASKNIAIWNGSTFVQAPIVGGAVGNSTTAIEIGPDDTTYIGWFNDSDPIIPSLVSVDHKGTGRTYLKFRFTTTVSTSGDGGLLAISNLKTVKNAYMNVRYMQVGDILQFDFNPRRPSMISSSTGDVSSAISPGSQSGQMYLMPGVQTLEILGNPYINGTGVFYWKASYNSIDSVWPQPLQGL